MVAGQFHTLALSSENELYAWGKGSYGRLGIATQDTIGSPSKVIFADGTINFSAFLPPNDRSGGSDDRKDMGEMLRTLGGSDPS